MKVYGYFESKPNIPLLGYRKLLLAFPNTRTILLWFSLRPPFNSVQKCINDLAISLGSYFTIEFLELFFKQLDGHNLFYTTESDEITCLSGFTCRS